MRKRAGGRPTRLLVFHSKRELEQVGQYNPISQWSLRAIAGSQLFGLWASSRPHRNL